MPSETSKLSSTDIKRLMLALNKKSLTWLKLYFGPKVLQKKHELLKSQSRTRCRHGNLFQSESWRGSIFLAGIQIENLAKNLEIVTDEEIGKPCLATARRMHDMGASLGLLLEAIPTASI